MSMLTTEVIILSSLLSTFFLFLAVILLFRYPKQDVPANVFASMVGILGIIVTLSGLTQISSTGAYIAEFIDSFTSLLAAIFVGIGLIWLARRTQMLEIFGWIAGGFWVIWGFGQIPFYFYELSFEEHTMYFYAFTVIGFASAISTVIFSALALPDRTRFGTEVSDTYDTDRSG